jgi:signal peptidase II
MVMVGCDHATKLAASAALRDRTVDVVPGVLDLQYTENHDVAFSLLRSAAIPGRPTVLLLLAAIGCLFVAFVWWRRRHLATTLEHVGWSLTMAGAMGNMVDRVLRGYVVDFIHVRHWPIFNVADALVVVGVMLLAFGRRTHRDADVV